MVSISFTFSSVSFWTFSSSFFWSSSVSRLSFFCFLMSSMASRRMERTATLLSSAFLRITLASSLRRSWVSSGKMRRMTLPSLAGLMPRSDFWMAFSTAGIILVSHRAIMSIRGSGTEMLPTWLMGVGEP